MNEQGDYVGIKTGRIYGKRYHYHSEQLKSKIVAVDDANKTGMYHLYGEDNEREDNKISWKRKYVGCIVTVERAHYADGLEVFRCNELGEYFTENEIELMNE
mgnify:CR=1 FL=1